MPKLIHAMIRVLDLDRSAAFYRRGFGLEESHRLEFPTFTLLYLREPESGFEIELTWNQGQTEPYAHGAAYGRRQITRRRRGATGPPARRGSVLALGAWVECADLGRGNRIGVVIAEMRPDIVDHRGDLRIAQGRRRPEESDGMPGAKRRHVAPAQQQRQRHVFPRYQRAILGESGITP